MTSRLALSLAIVLAISGAVATQAPPASLRQIIPGHYVYAFNNNGRLLNSGSLLAGGVRPGEIVVDDILGITVIAF